MIAFREKRFTCATTTGHIQWIYGLVSDTDAETGLKLIALIDHKQTSEVA